MSVQELAGKVAVVTGGTRRIGLEIAKELARGGAAVALVFAHDQAQAAQAVAAVEALGGRALAVRCDVGDPVAVRAMAATVAETLGGIHILVNNAAIRPHLALADISIDDWHAVLRLGLDGAFLCAQALAPHLEASGGGAIVNIGGLVAQTGNAQTIPVSAAKMGLVGLTRSLAHHFGPHDVTVNCLTPGSVGSAEDDPERRARQHATDTIPMRRIGTPADVALAVRALVGPAFRFVTGQTIHLNGGIHMA